MAKRNNAEEEQKGTCTWMMTFSDLSTLLLTFFVLLLSMSSLNKRAFRSAFVNFDKANGVLFFKSLRSPSSPELSLLESLIKTLKSVYLKEVYEIYNNEVEYIDEDLNMVTEGTAALLIKRKDSRSFSLVFGERTFFRKGSAALSPKAFPILEKIALFLKKNSYRAYIDGHTDSLPIHSRRFSSNLDLSIARAISILDFLMDRCAVPPRQLAVAGYGSAYPLADNKTEAGRALNRRVEIILKKMS